MVWTEIGDIVHHSPTQTMAGPAYTMTGLQEAGGGVREPGRGCCIAVGLSDVSEK